MALDIIGPGFGRTGTSSLKIALEHLGFGPVHHMFEVRDNPETQLPIWEAAAGGRLPDWDAAFAGYRAQVDWPGARYWRDLVGRYPAARVILTVREAEAWYDSMAATILPMIAGAGTHPVPLIARIGTMGAELVDRQVFGGRLADRTHAIAVFTQHIDEVRRTIAPERLLTFDVRSGWKPLCAFLGVPVPAISFPRLNSSKAFVEREWKQEA